MNKKRKNTGIYERSSTPVELDELRELLPAMKADYFDVTQLLGTLDEAIAEIEESSGDIISIAEANQPWPPDRGDVKETVSDAVTVRGLINQLKIRLEKTPEAREIAMVALHLGQVSNRLAIRPFEGVTRSGIKSAKGASTGGKKRALTPEERARRRSEWQLVLNEVCKKQPRITRKAQRERAAKIISEREDTSVSERTVQEYTVYPEPS